VNRNVQLCHYMTVEVKTCLGYCDAHLIFVSYWSIRQICSGILWPFVSPLNTLILARCERVTRFILVPFVCPLVA